MSYFRRIPVSTVAITVAIVFASQAAHAAWTKQVLKAEGNQNKRLENITLEPGLALIRMTQDGLSTFRLHELSPSGERLATLFITGELRAETLIKHHSGRPGIGLFVETTEQKGPNWTIEILQDHDGTTHSIPAEFDCSNEVKGPFLIETPFVAAWNRQSAGSASLYFNNMQGHAVKAIGEELMLGQTPRGDEIVDELTGKHWFTCPTGGSIVSLVTGERRMPATIAVTLTPTDKNAVEEKKAKNQAVHVARESSMVAAAAGDVASAAGSTKSSPPPKREKPKTFEPGKAEDLRLKLQDELQQVLGVTVTSGKAMDAGQAVMIQWDLSASPKSTDSLGATLEKVLGGSAKVQSMAGMTIVELTTGDGASGQLVIMPDSKMVLSLQAK